MLTPVNPAVCPHCSSSKTARGGYVKEKAGSAWACRDCNKTFVLKTLIIHRPRT